MPQFYDYAQARANYHDILHPAASTATGGTTSLGSGPVSSYDPAYGGIPSVPNPKGTQTDVLSGNIGNLGLLYNLATGTGQASAAGAGAALEQNLPGALGGLQQGLGNTRSLLSGQIPADVQRQIAQQAAERGVSTGSPGSANSNGSLMQALGLTSLGLQQQGLGNLSQLIGSTPTGPAFNPASMLLDPNSQQMWQYLANTLGAAPIPGVAGARNLAALQAAMNQARNQTGGANTLAGLTGAAPPTGSGALGFGFGQYGTNRAPTQAPQTGYGGVDQNTYNQMNDFWDIGQPVGTDQAMNDFWDIGQPIDQGFAQAPQTGGYFPDASTSDYWDMSSLYE